MVGVAIAVRQAAPVDDHGVVEQGAVAVGRRAKLADEVGELLHVVAVDLGDVGDLFGVAFVVAQAVVGVRHTDVSPSAVSIRFSISRTAKRYSSSLRRSVGPNSPFSFCVSSRTKSRMLFS